MVNRSDRARKRTNNTPVAPVATIPMPGRLAVDYYDELLACPDRGVLAHMKADTYVTATGTVTTVRPVAGSRVYIVLTDTNGDSALITFDLGLTGVDPGVLKEGARIAVSGRVVPATSMTPAGIVGHIARAAR